MCNASNALPLGRSAWEFCIDNKVFVRFLSRAKELTRCMCSGQSQVVTSVLCSLTLRGFMSLFAIFEIYSLILLCLCRGFFYPQLSCNIFITPITWNVPQNTILSAYISKRNNFKRLLCAIV